MAGPGLAACAPPAPGSDVVRQLLSRILSSRTFSRSPRLRDLLNEIGNQTLAGRADLLSEHSLGVSVFGRPGDYEPATDNIVRASARQLRLKLREYFESEGAGEEWTLEIPRGSYVAVFSRRLQVPLAAAIPAPAGYWRRLSRPALMLCASVLCLGLSAALFVGARIAVPSEPDTLIGRLCRSYSGPVFVVLTDSALNMQNHLLGPGSYPSLDAYADLSYLQGFTPRSPGQLMFWRMLAERQITSLADVGILTRLLQTHPSLARRVVIRHARHMRTRDFKQGNFILTGSRNSNPWTELFEGPLQFQFVSRGIANLSPQPGEPSFFARSPDTNKSPARVALTSNLTHSGFVLLIAGSSMEGTEGAGEFLCSGLSIDFLSRLGGKDAVTPPPFELILETTSSQGTASTTKIAALRRR